MNPTKTGMKKFEYTWQDKLIYYFETNKGRWALGLTYMADKKMRKPYEVAEGHLDIILNDIKNHIKTF